MQQYIDDMEMNQTSTWGTDVEILAMAHLLKTCVYIYDTEECHWLSTAHVMLTGASSLMIHKELLSVILLFIMMLSVQL